MGLKPDMDFLSRIIDAKRRRLAEAKAKASFEGIIVRGNRTRSAGVAHRFRHAFSGGGIHIIAEFKRRSPSKGDINSRADAMLVARAYETAGAAALSVLTEEDHFGGSLDDLPGARQATSIPIVRKDFIFDEYQIYETAAAGADALLLIAAALDDETLSRLRRITEDELGMDALVEVHNEEELERGLRCSANIIGVNNRNLRTFEVSTQTSFDLARLVPPELRLISESGLDPETISELRAVGYDGYLVGESLMRSEDPALALHDLIASASKPSARVKTKVCGITSLEDAIAASEAGADMLGFNFYRPSPRFIEPQTAGDIVLQMKLRRGLRTIGIFVNETAERVRQVAGEAHLDGIQLHGDETVEFCRQLKSELPDRFLIKAFQPRADLDVEELRQHPADAILLDGFDGDLRGGTGKVADWSIAQAAAEHLPRVILAGGLSPENVGEAIAAVGPYGVDACSSLEMTPGQKDHARVRQFVAAARASKLPNKASAL
jgi:indole-3-glycerol phosphate synthase/phosphoribosylanthranilate isomerase